MALIECREMMPSLRNTTRFFILIPEEGAVAAKAVLWLLPVRRGHANDWVRYTSIELWSRKAGIAVVMPEGLSSDFCNMKYGMHWWTFISEELPQHLNRLFGLYTEENNLCFGAEMGALGAIKLGLLYSERFTAVGAVDTDFTCVEAYANGDIECHNMETIYGKWPVSEDVLSASDPMRIVEACVPADTTLFLKWSDNGAQTIASKSGYPVIWCNTEPIDWETYGTCLKEFLDKTVAKEV